MGPKGLFEKSEDEIRELMLKTYDPYNRGIELEPRKKHTGVIKNVAIPTSIPDGYNAEYLPFSNAGFRSHNNGVSYLWDEETQSVKEVPDSQRYSGEES